MLVDRNRLFPGERLGLRIRAINAKVLPVLIKIDLFTHSGFPVSSGISGSVRRLFCPGTRNLFLPRNCIPKKERCYDLGPARVRCGDLFGFFPREKLPPEQFEVVVYPRLRDVRPITLSRREFFGVPGARSPLKIRFLFSARGITCREGRLAASTGRPAHDIIDCRKSSVNLPGRQNMHAPLMSIRSMAAGQEKTLKEA